MVVYADAVPTLCVRCISSDTYYNNQNNLPEVKIDYDNLKETMFYEIP